MNNSLLHNLSELHDRVRGWALENTPSGKHAQERATGYLTRKLPLAVRTLAARGLALNPQMLSTPGRRTCAMAAGAALALGTVVTGTVNTAQGPVLLERASVVSELPAASEAEAPAAGSPEENGQGSAVAVQEVTAEAAAEPVAEPAPAVPAAPLDELRVTSPFGWRINPLLANGAMEWHTGIDFGAAYDTPVKASAPGTVVYAQYHEAGGLRIVVDHGDGVQTTYNHLNDIFVEVGQQVNVNDVIGAIGSTGNSTGPHLHFEVLINGEYQDPAVWLGL